MFGVLFEEIFFEEIGFSVMISRFSIMKLRIANTKSLVALVSASK